MANFNSIKHHNFYVNNYTLGLHISVKQQKSLIFTIEETKDIHIFFINDKSTLVFVVVVLPPSLHRLLSLSLFFRGGEDDEEEDEECYG